MSSQRTAGFALLALLAFAAGMLPWVIASDVRAEVAEQRPVLLGRYSLAWFSWLALAITPACWALALGLWARRTRSHRYVVFRLTLALFIAVACVVVAEIAGRYLQAAAPMENSTMRVAQWPADRGPGNARTRPARVRYEVTVEDVPPTSRSYPDAPPGLPPTEVVLATDGRGYRNAETLERCDVVVLGGACAEGTRVAREATWPAIVATAIGEPVYNLGVAGAHPGEALVALREVALALEPRVIVLILDEHTDLQAIVPLPAGVELEGETKPRIRGPGDQLAGFLTASPVRRGVARAFTSWCGAVKTDEPVPGWEPLEWMPVRLAAANGAKAYAFTPTEMMGLHTPREAFEASYAWQSVRATLEALKQSCRDRGIRVVVAFAPSKPRVVLPLVAERIPAAGLHIFAACAGSEGLPAPDVFKRELLERLAVKEEAVSRWCRYAGVAFVPMAEALRARMRAGEQVYWTYDPGWTAAGHAVAARRILDVLQR